MKDTDRPKAGEVRGPRGGIGFVAETGEFTAGLNGGRGEGGMEGVSKSVGRSVSRSCE